MRRLIRNLIAMALGLTLGMVTSTVLWQAFAQTPKPEPAPSCEQQLEVAQMENLRIQKEVAQCLFRAASVSEQALNLQKQLATEKAKGTHSEVKPK